MQALLSGFSGNFGGEIRTALDLTTLSGFVDFARASTQAVSLLVPAAELARRCQEAARETEADLQETMDPAFARVFEELRDCFAESAAVLSQLRKRLKDGRSVAKQLDRLDDLHQDISQLSRCLAGWTSGQEPHCARCGSRGQEVICGSCDLQRLRPDPCPDPNVRSAHLPPLFVVVYETYRNIVNGDACLRQLESVLGPLEKDLLQMQWLSRISPISLHQEAEECLQGLDRMRNACQSRQMADLNKGWTQVFHGAAALGEKLPSLLRAMGQAEQANAVEHSHRLSDESTLRSRD